MRFAHFVLELHKHQQSRLYEFGFTNPGKEKRVSNDRKASHERPAMLFGAAMRLGGGSTHAETHIGNINIAYNMRYIR